MSVIGVLLNGTSSESAYLAITAGTLACSFGIIVSTALVELVRAVDGQ